MEIGSGFGRWLARRLALGEAWNDLGLAFDRGDGRPLTHGAAARALARAAKRLGLPRVTPHDLRRTSATLMQGVGADPLALGRRLGHADAATTALYVARSTAGQREPAEALAAAIREARDAGG